MAFATVEDVELRWHKLMPDEQAKAAALLDDAEVLLRGLVTVRDGDERQQSTLAMVSCNMVIRAMVAGSSEAFGVEELTATMGPFSQTAQYANPSGDLYLTRMEKRILGIGGKGRILHPYEVVADA